MRKMRNNLGKEIIFKFLGWLIISLFILFCQVGCLINYVIQFLNRDNHDT